MQARLYRSRDDAMISGVCGGLGDYLALNSGIIRLFFVLLAPAGNGVGALIYFLLWLVVPLEGQRHTATLQETIQTGSMEIAERTRRIGDDLNGMVTKPHPQVGVIIGAALIIYGTFYVLDRAPYPWLDWLNIQLLWPLLLILGGLTLLLRRTRG
jgi:phage shock protein C